jgi:NADPH:quinone reductase-like Zn-dependent oxidoreductase
MKFGGPEVLALHDVAAPSAGSGQVVVDVSVIPSIEARTTTGKTLLTT